MDSLLLTGGSGFVGRHMAPHLRGRYRVATLGRGASNDIRADLSESVPELGGRFDVVVHAAALAHPSRHTLPDDYMAVNVDGTRRLCESLEHAGVPRSLIFLSSVAVYGCDDGAAGVDESWPLAGTSPYARSKILGEQFLREWCGTHGVHLAIVRLPVLLGADAPGNMGRMIRGISRGFYVGIGRGCGMRSLTSVDDLAGLIPLLDGRDGVWNIVGQDIMVRDLERMICAAVGRRFLPRIPTVCAKAAACAGDCLGNKFPLNNYRLRVITRSLTFSSAAARRDLGWNPAPVAPRFVL